MSLTRSRASFILQANVMFSRLLSGGGYDPVVLISNCTQFDIQPQGNIDSIQGREIINYNQTLDSVSRADDLAITMSANRFSGANLAMALLGTEAANTANSATDATSYVIPIQDGFASLPYLNVTSVTITGATVTTDFTLDSNGNVLIVTGGALDGDTELTVTSQTYDELVGSEITIGATSDLKGKLWVKGVNLTNNKKMWIYLREATITPNAPLTLIGDDTRSTVTFSGTAATPSGQTDPGIMRIAA